MKSLMLRSAALGAMFSLSLQAMAGAQSLGEIARKLRAQQDAEGKKAVRVYTNDTIPHASGTPSSAPTGKTASSPSQVQTGPKSWNPAIGLAQRAAHTQSSSAPLGGAAESSATPARNLRTRAYWQARFKVVRARLARAKEEQTLSQNELKLLQLQKQQTLDPNQISSLSNTISAKQADLSEKEAGTARAEKALDSLNQEFKASGAPADWSKTP